MGFDPVLVDSRALRLAGHRREHATPKAMTQVPLQWAELMGFSPLPGQISEIGYGVREELDAERTRLAYTAAVEVDRFDDLPAGVHRFAIPPTCYAVFTGFENVATLRRAWPALLDQWLPRSGHQRATTPSFERYDENFDPIAGRGGMAIWLAVLRG